MWNHWFFEDTTFCLPKEDCNFKSSKKAALLLRVGVRLGNCSVGLQLDETVSSLLHNLCLLHHVEACVKLSIGQRLLITPPLLFHRLCGPNKVADQLDRLPVGVVAFKAGVDELAEVVKPLAVNSKLLQTVALWPVVDGRRGTTENGKHCFCHHMKCRHNAPKHGKHLANESLSLVYVGTLHLKVIDLRRRVLTN